ncbi:MAG: hypothetical protein ACETWT_12725 [Thermodesulfobacteriota bacterium]
MKGEREESHSLPERFGGINVFDLLGLGEWNHSRTPFAKTLFWGEGTVVLSSYLAGLVAASGMKPIFVDGANGFDPYIVSRFARRHCLAPAHLLKEIVVARAFTCYQLFTLVRERLEAMIDSHQNPLVILLGPITTLLDEDIPEQEVNLLFRGMLAKLDELNPRGLPFLLMQPPVPSRSRRGYLLRRLSRWSDMVVRTMREGGRLKLVLERPLRTEGGGKLLRSQRLPLRGLGKRGHIGG